MKKPKIVQKITTNSYTPGVNEKSMIVLHHTATGAGTIRGVLRTLSVGGQVSCHYVVDTNGDVYQIGNEDMILWHAGHSIWDNKSNNQSVNYRAIGIEVIGPLPGFTDAQRESVRDLILDIAMRNNISAENIVRHRDVSTTGKVDIEDSFFASHGSWRGYISYLFSFLTQKMETKFTKIMQEELASSGMEQLFSSYDGQNPLTEQEVRELITIAFCRFYKKYFAKK